MPDSDNLTHVQTCPLCTD